MNILKSHRKLHSSALIALAILFLTSFTNLAYADSTLSPIEEATVKGARFLTTTFAASYDSHLGHTFNWQLSDDHYVLNHFSLSYGATIGYANPNRAKEGVFGGPQIGLRWHFLRGERWSLDLEALAAAVVHQHPLTSQSLHFNFDLEPGIGMSYMITDDMMLRSGARWHHLSNARVQGKEHNLGYDGPMAYLQLLKSF